jgi:hypothetical protein
MAVRRPRRARTIGKTGSAVYFPGEPQALPGYAQPTTTGNSATPSQLASWYGSAAAAPTSVPDPVISDTETPEERAAREARERARALRMQGLTDEDASDETNYSEMLRRYRENLPRQQRNALISANRMGLVNSTTRAEQEGDIITNQQRGEADMQTARNERKAAREAARRLLEAGGELEDAEALAAGAQARGAEYEEMADEGMLAAVNPGIQSRLAPGIQPQRTQAARAPGRLASGGGPQPAGRGRQQRTTGSAVRKPTRRPRRRR